MRRRLPLLAPLALLAGCDGIQSVTGGDGHDGALFNDLFAIFMVVCALFYAAVLAFLAAAWFRRRGARADGIADGDEAPSREKPLRIALFAWTGAVVIGIAGLTLGSFLTDRSMAEPRRPDMPVLSVEVIAKQWWWDVRYHFADASMDFRTANELHLPVGVPTHVTLKSSDVIHSFWIPNIAGKQDMIPGVERDILLLPRRTGRFRGQCAEFCGIQHAHMALDVFVDSDADFGRWLNGQIRPAAPPSTPLARAGHDYFMNRECSVCHAITGTPASGQVAPDLTHLASRKSIAAGTFPMTRGHLYAWVADPQGAKPGNHMPYIGLEPAELHAVVAYLESLK